MGATVTSIRSNVEDNPDLIYIRAWAAAKALSSAQTKAEKVLADTVAKWASRKKDVTAKYREILRGDDAADAGPDQSRALLTECICLLAQHDKIRDDGNTDKKSKRTVVAQIEDALAEVMASSATEGTQTTLFADVPGMHWASKGTREVVYRALLMLDEDGAMLDTHQQALMLDLASADVNPAVLGLDAAAAIENDEAIDEDDEAGEDEAAEEDVF